MRAAERLGDDLVDDAELLQIFRGQFQGFRRDFFLIAAAPEDEAQPSGEITE
jgi:hypothetical protein